MISVRIRAYELEVEVQSSESHPDALTDAANRATTAFVMAINTMKASEIDLYDADRLPNNEELE